jgi:hypothetical protein
MAGFDRIPGVDEDYKFPEEVRTALKDDLVEISGSPNIIYARDAVGAVLLPYGHTVNPEAVVRRDDAGTFDIPEPTELSHPVTKEYADAIVPPWVVVPEGDPIPGGTPTGTIIFRSAP